MGWTRRRALGAALGSGLGMPLASMFPAWGQGGSSAIKIVIGKSGHIFARAKVKNDDVYALLDNTHVTAIALESSLLSAGERSTARFGSRDDVYAPFRIPLTYKFGNAQVFVDFAMRGLAAYSERNGFPVDLLLGKSVFEQTVVELDFRAGTMLFHGASGFKAPDGAVAFGGGADVGSKAGGGMLVPVKLGDDLSGLARVSLGFSGIIRVSHPKVNDWLNDGRKVQEGEVTTVYGALAVKGGQQTFQSPPLKVGSWDFGPVTAWADPDQQAGVVGMLGATALRPFKVWLDESHGRIWMKPNM
jgi:hypothetical protein